VFSLSERFYGGLAVFGLVNGAYRLLAQWLLPL
jgi:hypothetical protein